eukprot:2629077-Pyramimonas_sp.AAC.1
MSLEGITDPLRGACVLKGAIARVGRRTLGSSFLLEVAWKAGGTRLLCKSGVSAATEFPPFVPR